jgi:hypothetical protein
MTEYIFDTLKVIGAIIALVVVGIIIPKFYQNKLPAKRFTTLLAISFGAAILFTFGNHITGFRFSEFQIETDRRIVEAKAAQVERMAERVADLAASITEAAVGSSTADWAGPSIPNIVKSRNNAVALLKESDAPEHSIQTISERFNRLILNRLKRDALELLGWNYPNELNRVNLKTNFYPEFQPEKVESALKSLNLWTSPYTNAIATIEYFQKNHELPDDYINTNALKK